MPRLARLEELESAGTNTIVFSLTGSSDEAKQAVRAAVDRTERAGLAFAYWIEVARSPELANEHPEWMASLQTHDEWRRLFPKGSTAKGERGREDLPVGSDPVTRTFPSPARARADFARRFADSQS